MNYCIECTKHSADYRCCEKRGKVCNYCARYLCKICYKKPAFVHLTNQEKKQLQSTGNKRENFCCHSPDQTMVFDDKNCGKRYCKNCISKAYQRTLANNNVFSSNYREIKLQCGCKYLEDKILFFINSSCCHCGKKAYQKYAIKMKNGLLLDEYCYRSISQSYIKKDKQFYQSIKNFIELCVVCNDPIDSFYKKRENTQKEMIICEPCFSSSQRLQIMKPRKTEFQRKTYLQKRSETYESKPSFQQSPLKKKKLDNSEINVEMKNIVQPIKQAKKMNQKQEIAIKQQKNLTCSRCKASINNINHADFKLQNIIICQNCYKLRDFQTKSILNKAVSRINAYFNDSPSDSRKITQCDTLSEKQNILISQNNDDSKIQKYTPKKQKPLQNNREPKNDQIIKENFIIQLDIEKNRNKYFQCVACQTKVLKENIIFVPVTSKEDQIKKNQKQITEDLSFCKVCFYQQKSILFSKSLKVNSQQRQTKTQSPSTKSKSPTTQKYQQVPLQIEQVKIQSHVKIQQTKQRNLELKLDKKNKKEETTHTTQKISLIEKPTKEQTNQKKGFQNRKCIDCSRQISSLLMETNNGFCLKCLRKKNQNLRASKEEYSQIKIEKQICCKMCQNMVKQTNDRKCPVCKERMI